jgi:hypothetical protein
MKQESNQHTSKLTAINAAWLAISCKNAVAKLSMRIRILINEIGSMASGSIFQRLEEGPLHNG